MRLTSYLMCVMESRRWETGNILKIEHDITDVEAHIVCVCVCVAEDAVQTNENVARIVEDMT